MVPTSPAPELRAAVRAEAPVTTRPVAAGESVKDALRVLGGAGAVAGLAARTGIDADAVHEQLRELADEGLVWRQPVPRRPSGASVHRHRRAQPVWRLAAIHPPPPVEVAEAERRKPEPAPASVPRRPRRTCDVCGSDFAPQLPAAKRCSDRCRRVASRSASHPCVGCGAPLRGQWKTCEACRRQRESEAAERRRERQAAKSRPRAVGRTPAQRADVCRANGRAGSDRLRDERQQRVAATLGALNGRAMTATEVAEAIGAAKPATSTYLRELVRERRVVKEGSTNRARYRRAEVA